jgi:hypothetical protein
LNSLLIVVGFFLFKVKPRRAWSFLYVASWTCVKLRLLVVFYCRLNTLGVTFSLLVVFCCTLNPLEPTFSLYFFHFVLVLLCCNLNPPKLKHTFSCNRTWNLF